MCDDDDDSDGVMGNDVGPSSTGVDGGVGGKAASASCSRRSSRAAWATDFSQLLRKILSRCSRVRKMLKTDSKNFMLSGDTETKVAASTSEAGYVQVLQGAMVEGEG